MWLQFLTNFFLSFHSLGGSGDFSLYPLSGRANLLDKNWESDMKDAFRQSHGAESFLLLVAKLEYAIPKT